MKAGVAVMTSGPERLQAGQWRGDDGTAFLAPLPDAAPPTRPFVERCLRELTSQGYRKVITVALTPREGQAFVASGFSERERLRLLVHDLADIPDAPRAALRRAHGSDWPAVVAVDRASFSSFWHLDEVGIDQSVRATATARFRVATNGYEVGGDEVVGYSITGRSGREGYLQRLAVVPARRRQGLGRALAIDGLRWLRRWRVAKAAVNTQLDNGVATDFYLSLGFVPAPADLIVYGRDLV